MGLIETTSASTGDDGVAGGGVEPRLGGGGDAALQGEVPRRELSARELLSAGTSESRVSTEPVLEAREEVESAASSASAEFFSHTPLMVICRQARIVCVCVCELSLAQGRAGVCVCVFFSHTPLMVICR